MFKYINCQNVKVTKFKTNIWKLIGSYKLVCQQSNSGVSAAWIDSILLFLSHACDLHIDYVHIMHLSMPNWDKVDEYVEDKMALHPTVCFMTKVQQSAIPVYRPTHL